jgi:hypothetical protein
VRPDTDAGEEVALREPLEVARLNVRDAPLVNLARRDVPGVDQVAEPLSGERVELVVVGGHARPMSSS